MKKIINAAVILCVSIMAVIIPVHAEYSPDEASVSQAVRLNQINRIQDGATVSYQKDEEAGSEPMPTEDPETGEYHSSIPDGTWAIYNSQGMKIGETNDPESFDVSRLNNQLGTFSQNPKKSVLFALVTIVYSSMAVINTVYDFADNVCRTIDWVNTYIHFDLPDGKYTIIIYSSDGNINNPYPPNSYQGAIWKQNNFYYVVQ